MTLYEQLVHDLKAAMLQHDAQRVAVLRSLKSAITYAEVAKGSEGKGSLSEQQIQAVLVKSAKQRQESADSYRAVGQPQRAEQELAEKQIIDAYLPKPLSEAEVQYLITQAISEIGAVSSQTFGPIVRSVKEAAAGRADGALIARLVKEAQAQE